MINDQMDFYRKGIRIRSQCSLPHQKKKKKKRSAPEPSNDAIVFGICVLQKVKNDDDDDLGLKNKQSNKHRLLVFRYESEVFPNINNKLRN